MLSKLANLFRTSMTETANDLPPENKSKHFNSLLFYQRLKQ